ncbi:hypothetical protein N7508_004769 [Penicillium antarcticum]|uniref:uncharacterized protein n=1 Tax=Penicillium antarcticum TaxID=416450 RepID=UPI00238A908A|nr:uncharacterized protein N7508_004769 [Penicillium antarcticum]KAJ5305754.1 hypothetical protein N7508_004769 [Penicillium antarcticum]
MPIVATKSGTLSGSTLATPLFLQFHQKNLELSHIHPATYPHCRRFSSTCACFATSGTVGPSPLLSTSASRAADTQRDGESNAVMKPELVAGASTAKIHNRFFATRTPTRWETVVHAGAYVLLFLTPLYLSNQTKSMVQNTRNKKTEAKQQKRSGEKSKSSKSRQRKKNCSSMTLTAQKEKRFISRMSIDTKKKGYGNEVKPTKNIRSKMLNITDRKCEKQRSANDERNYMQRTGSGGYVKWKQNKSDCEWRG